MAPELSRRCVTLSLVVCTFSLAGAVQAMSIRDDAAKSAYQALVATAPFDASGRFNNEQSGTLVAPTWVLGAAHFGGASTFTTVNGSASVVQRIVYPGDPGAGNALDGADFALFELNAPIPGNSIAPLYQGAPDALVGMAAVLAGGGDVGDGDTGAINPRELLAGTNVIDQVGWDFPPPDLLGTIPNILVSDFDDPDYGDSTLMALEMGLARKDSGGGLFVNLGGGYLLAGVHSAVSDDNDGIFGEYGQRNFSTALTDPVRTWIVQTAPEPTSLTLFMLAGAGLVARRRG